MNEHDESLMEGEKMVLSLVSVHAATALVVADLFGWTRHKAAGILDNLRAKGYVKSTVPAIIDPDVRFKLTSKGEG